MLRKKKKGVNPKLFPLFSCMGEGLEELYTSHLQNKVEMSENLYHMPTYFSHLQKSQVIRAHKMLVFI